MNVTAVLGGVACGLALSLANAQAGIFTYTDNIPLTVEGGYPPSTSTLDLSNYGLGNILSSGDNVSMTLNISGISGGGYNGNLVVYLNYEVTKTVHLISNPGFPGPYYVGYTDPGYNVTLSDGNYQNINNQGSYNFPSSQLTGTYNPLDGNVAFQTYNGLSPNGHWVLTIDNELGGTSFTLNSWSLTLDTVPEPVNVALGVFGLLFATILMVSRRADSPLMKKQPA